MIATDLILIPIRIQPFVSKAAASYNYLFLPLTLTPRTIICYRVSLYATKFSPA